MDMKFTFFCGYDPRIETSFENTFQYSEFKKVPEGSGIFKLAAQKQLSKLSNQAKIVSSVKYQVLCEETAMIGVVKQKIKSTGEMKEYKIDFNKEASYIQQIKPQPQHHLAVDKSIQKKGSGFSFSSLFSMGNKSVPEVKDRKQLKSRGSVMASAESSRSMKKSRAK